MALIVGVACVVVVAPDVSPEQCRRQVLSYSAISIEEPKTVSMACLRVATVQRSTTGINEELARPVGRLFGAAGPRRRAPPGLGSWAAAMEGSATASGTTGRPRSFLADCSSTWLYPRCGHGRAWPATGRRRRGRQLSTARGGGPYARPVTCFGG